MDLIAAQLPSIYNAFADLYDTFTKTTIELILQEETLDVFNEDRNVLSERSVFLNVVIRDRGLFFDELQQKIQGTYDTSNVIFWVFTRQEMLPKNLVAPTGELLLRKDFTYAIIYGVKYRMTYIGGAGFLEGLPVLFQFRAEIAQK